ncbi:hypothetical protein ACFQE5_20570 [Pseudonocardia hispaniensis]|uniref:ATP/GTP-binding protein n=1 Tax=Pseudonocardia hispaniensis TaxID=904933 RepID=A0ABW1J8B2_9PSEU
MPRSNPPRRRPHVPLRSAAITRTHSGADGDWLVRSVPGSASLKDYRCPGCDQVIPAGTGHVVAWPAGEYGSVEDRRHWHAPCWDARERRRPGRRRR